MPNFYHWTSTPSTMYGHLSISLLHAITWGTLASALVPVDATITAPALLPRQNADRFIGWVETSGTWSSQQCNVGLTWYQDGKYAQCCPVTMSSCYAPTACVDGFLIYPYSDQSTTSTIACTDDSNDAAYSICNTALIYENFEDSDPMTDIVCGQFSLNWSYYRKVPASATEKPSVTPDEPSTPGSGNSSPTPGSPEPTGKQKSKVWIAGAVAGPVGGLLIIGAIVFFLMRHKKNNAPAGPPTVGTVGSTLFQQHTDTKPVFIQHGAYVQPSPGHNPNNPYDQQNPNQQPAPQYGAPYSPPLEGSFAPDKQLQHHTRHQSGAVELATGANSTTSVPTHAAELAGEITRQQR
ncbi:hypothetical protein BDV95DRAFT_359223 [Massariosphaeria phaeospora]|uniref:Uncharacterized protein n=1 Tax=Massariosphaeria phaeospora TaxID=100035 RepID=A0A7C8M7M1_9PLEO|nr:hypothetical protein BDV95DRAFT_359223 [Massariosphaeria phaeospora]